VGIGGGILWPAGNGFPFSEGLMIIFLGLAAVCLIMGFLVTGVIWVGFWIFGIFTPPEWLTFGRVRQADDAWLELIVSNVYDIGIQSNVGFRKTDLWFGAPGAPPVTQAFGNELTDGAAKGMSIGQSLENCPSR
jgi:hypothetical protein